MSLIEKLFIVWDLDTWANILGIIGFIFSVGAFFIGLLIKSQIRKLRSEYLFDRRVAKHINNLQNSTSEINQLLNNYDANKELIKVEFSNCISELKDLLPKISYRQGYKARQMITFLRRRNKRPFADAGSSLPTLIQFLIRHPVRIFQTTQDDVWIGYRGILEIIRQLENIKLNKQKSL